MGLLTLMESQKNKKIACSLCKHHSINEVAGVAWSLNGVWKKEALRREETMASFFRSVAVGPSSKLG